MVEEFSVIKPKDVYQNYFPAAFAFLAS